MLTTAILTLCVLIVKVSSSKKYVATFENNNFTGEVIVDNGMVTVELDLSSQPDFGLAIDYATCIDGGLKWHIHRWFYDNDASDKLGSDCGASHTGGHIDPWHACGPASGNIYCATKTNTYNYSCINTSTYEPNFPAKPYSVEVGDWSGKYGAAILENDTFRASFSSFYEVTPDDFDEFSVVFHCNNGDRAFCAPFLISSEDTESTIPSQSNEQVVVAKFNTLSENSMIILSPDGAVSGMLNAKEYYADIVVSESPGCSEYEYTIFNAKSTGSLDSETSINGADCLTSIDTQYDPTRQCLPWSDSNDCMDGLLCGDPEYEYDCDWTEEKDRYSCAPGDLSGKYGTLEPTTPKEIQDDGRDTLLPPTDSLIGKIIAIHCSYNDQTQLEVLSCAMIQEYTMDTTQEPGDGAAPYSIMVLSIIISMAVVYL